MPTLAGIIGLAAVILLLVGLWKWAHRDHGWSDDSTVYEEYEEVVYYEERWD